MLRTGATVHLPLVRHLGSALALALALLSAGTLGYRLTASPDWLGRHLNASMMLIRVGPLAALATPATKLFAMLRPLRRVPRLGHDHLGFPLMQPLLRKANIEAYRTRQSLRGDTNRDMGRTNRLAEQPANRLKFFACVS